nr:hypothetical protein B11C_200136 [Bartonella sp. 1-1C]
MLLPSLLPNCELAQPLKIATINSTMKNEIFEKVILFTLSYDNNKLI